MKTKKIILIAVAVVVVVGAGIWFFAGSPAKHKVTYATTTVSKGDISNSVTATGTIEPVTEVEVGTQVSGIIDTKAPQERVMRQTTKIGLYNALDIGSIWLQKANAQ